ncbi:dTDP-4-keto-6-deoxy-D-glucose epimerase [Candidatus Saccharibacteria bacterium]|nr:MAG: dTDP-4-keto-6-deoxy-D-glucose epimerase [Candidatus Saccharibacteria bacterium]
MAVPTTEVIAQQTDIPGLLIFNVTAMRDDRGYYQETYQKQKLVAAGMPESFNVVQTSTSYNKTAGVTRGFHAEPWDKYLTVLKGSVFAAFVDLRQGESFGKTVTVEVKPETAVYLPKGVGNSFQTLEDDTFYLYSVNAHWSAELYDEYCFANLADPAIGIDWPIPLDQAVMSERDKNHPLLKDAKRFENHE